MDAAYDPPPPVDVIDVDAVDVSDLVAGMLGVTDLPAVPDDIGEAFADVPPEWQKLTGAALEHFDLGQLPAFLRPIAPVALQMLARKLAEDPASSRAGLLELIEEAVCDLGITVDELRCWDPAGLPYAEPQRAR